MKDLLSLIVFIVTFTSIDWFLHENIWWLKRKANRMYQKSLKLLIEELDDKPSKLREDHAKSTEEHLTKWIAEVKSTKNIVNQIFGYYEGDKLKSNALAKLWYEYNNVLSEDVQYYASISYVEPDYDHMTDWHELRKAYISIFSSRLQNAEYSQGIK